ncbi:hypothetical protein YC2023_109517 [Brassica napus]
MGISIFYPSLKLENPDKGSYPPFNSFRITEPYFLRSCVCKSVEGLILILGPDGLVIWNPTSQRFSTIPHPSEKYAGTINQNCYVLFRIRSVGGYVNTKFSAKNLTNIPRRCEFLHWENNNHWYPYGNAFINCRTWAMLQWTRFLGDHHEIIMSFDINSESFKPIKYPEALSRLVFDMTPCEGRLVFVTHRAGLK